MYGCCCCARGAADGCATACLKCSPSPSSSNFSEFSYCLAMCLAPLPGIQWVRLIAATSTVRWPAAIAPRSGSPPLHRCCTMSDRCTAPLATHCRQQLLIEVPVQRQMKFPSHSCVVFPFGALSVGSAVQGRVELSRIGVGHQRFRITTSPESPHPGPPSSRSVDLGFVCELVTL